MLNRISRCLFLLGFLILSKDPPPVSANHNVTSPLMITPTAHITGQKRHRYEAYLGIPYAQPPVGNLRFKNPQPIPLWNGYRMAVTPQVGCWQAAMEWVAEASEDCLYLDIFRPESASIDNPLKVLFYIHGGGSTYGVQDSRFFSPVYFMQTQDVIVVTVSYRMNVFGFLSTGDEAASGNFGLKDQTMALKWVRDHIAAFGGDHHGVTLMGHEAGAVFIHYHLISQHSAGLYNGAFLLSGVLEAPWAQPAKHPRDLLNLFASNLHMKELEKVSNVQLVEKLRAFSAPEIMKALWEVNGLNRVHGFPYAVFLPVVEKDTAEDPFLVIGPEDSLKHRLIQSVPIMVSVVPGDGAYFARRLIKATDQQIEDFNKNIYVQMPGMLSLDPNHPNMTSVIDRIREKYFGSSHFLARDVLRNVLDMTSHYFFHYPFYDFLRKMKSSTEVPIYAQIIDYHGNVTGSRDLFESDADFGMIHGDELKYLFPPEVGNKVNGVDLYFADYLVGTIVNFVNYGKPGYDEFKMHNQKVTRFFAGKQNLLETQLVDVEQHKFWEEIMAMTQPHEGKPIQ